ncbi:hypothetical protein P5673_014731 [Acropora cervicornis]|uniref:Uncharacterized protein n=1 Tax=Acropora cervicornis TaxID=6130 RepID=A0AAD9V5H1_ACRCE|nr:hypothetical protein P5673_014731 [Acropora cervicornis]
MRNSPIRPCPKRRVNNKLKGGRESEQIQRRFQERRIFRAAAAIESLEGNGGFIIDALSCYDSRRERNEF